MVVEESVTACGLTMLYVRMELFDMKTLHSIESTRDVFHIFTSLVHLLATYLHSCITVESTVESTRPQSLHSSSSQIQAT